MPSYAEEQYIHSLEKSLKEKDAMIDFLISQLIAKDTAVSHGGFLLDNRTPEQWRKFAERAVKKND